MGNKKLNRDSSDLFLKKEYRVIQGKNNANWWILAVMFLVTILSISFSKSSLSYLDKKMNDPFINWVNVQNRTDAPISKLIMELNDPIQLKQLSGQFGFKNIEQNIYRNINFITSNRKVKPFEGRTTKINSPILTRILGKENLIEGRSHWASDKTIGLIITKDMLTRMGYEDIPLFIHLAYPYLLRKEQEVHDLNLLTSLDYLGSPIPVLAVVKELPGMMSFLCTEYFVQQRDNQESTFNLIKEEYTKTIEFATSDPIIISEFSSVVEQLTTKSHTTEQRIENNAFEDYTLFTIYFDRDEHISLKDVGDLTRAIENKFASNNLWRVFTYQTSGQTINVSTDYLSIDFSHLDSIQSFAYWAYDECGVKIDMTQIDAKNNFGIISRLGNSLSIAIVMISMAFIVVFIINLFRSHFEKVKRNIGTFKAFGLGDRALIGIYMQVLSRLIITALLAALLSALVLEFVSFWMGLSNEGEAIINVLSNYTLYAILATVIISLIAVYFTVSKLLKSTPGDLIYERD